MGITLGMVALAFDKFLIYLRFIFKPCTTTLISMSKVTVESIKKISVFYNEVCNNKLFDCHHSDKDT